LGIAMSATPGETTSNEGKCIMATKKNAPTTPAAGLQALKIGSRVRCTDDRVEGRIVWANGVSMKIKWNDGEQVTWRRDSLAGRPIEILSGDEDQAAAPTAEQTKPPQTADETAAAAPAATTTEPNAASADIAAATEAQPAAVGPEASPDPAAATEGPTAATEQTEPHAATEEAPTPAPEAMAGSPAAAAASEPTQTAAKPKRQRKAPTEPQEKKLSALDAAAKVLAETRTPMTCQELIGAMAAKGYWTSPGGKTPAATLYSALLREVTTKGDQARFTKTERGKFDLAKRG
jgi:HB1, ASXL, restriction endonuclease HTH domain